MSGCYNEGCRNEYCSGCDTDKYILDCDSAKDCRGLVCVECVTKLGKSVLRGWENSVLCPGCEKDEADALAREDELGEEEAMEEARKVKGKREGNVKESTSTAESRDSSVQASKRERQRDRERQRKRDRCSWKLCERRVRF